MKREGGFLVLEILIAGLILTASIAATMFLFRLGAENIERVNNSNLISSKVPQTVSLIKSLDLGRNEGSEELGDGVLLTWKAMLMEKTRPEVIGEFVSAPGNHEISLYEVDFSLDNGRLKREYRINVFRYKALVSPEDIQF